MPFAGIQAHHMLQNIVFPISFVLLFHLVFLKAFKCMHFLGYKNITNRSTICIIIPTIIVVFVQKSAYSHGFEHIEQLAALPAAGQLHDILKGGESTWVSLLISLAGLIMPSTVHDVSNR